MKAADFLMDPALIGGLQGGDVPPLILLDFDSCGPSELLEILPPCPVIGLGDSAHPCAKQVDSLVEDPIGLEGLIRSILARPNTSAILVQALRLIESLPVQQALVAESFAYATVQCGEEHLSWQSGTHGSALDSPPGKLRVERSGDVLKIAMDRPGSANAIDVALRDALREAFDMAVVDESIARIELRGEGKAFGVGAELAEFGTTRDPAAAHAIRLRTLPAYPAARCADRLTVYVQGLCIGSSLELAAFGARIEAERSAVFQLPELKMGLIPGAGGCVSVSRRIGRQRTALMVLSGRRIGAQTALDWGLVDSVVD